MCKSAKAKPPHGFRCESCTDPLHKAVTVAKQSLNRHLTNLAKAEAIGDSSEVDKHYELFNTGVLRLMDRERDEAAVRGPLPAPGDTRAAEFTPDASAEYSDNQLRSILTQLRYDPEAQDQAQATLDARYEQSAVEALDGWADRRISADPDAERQDLHASLFDADWGGPLNADRPGHDEYPEGKEEWAEHHVVYEVPDLNDAELFRTYLRQGGAMTPDERCRAAYEDFTLTQFVKAHKACSGLLLNSAGKRKAVRAYDLFQSTEGVARRFASDELQAWWAKHGRQTYPSFRYVYLGRAEDRRAWELERIERPAPRYPAPLPALNARKARFKAVRDGKAAYESGEAPSACPYLGEEPESVQLRRYWVKGWMNGRLARAVSNRNSAAYPWPKSA